MNDISSLILVFLVGLAASVIGSMVGGGSLLSIPTLILLGLPPHVAIASDRFAGIGAGITALIKFSKEKRVVFKYVIPLSIISLVAALIGGKILLEIDTAILENIVAVLIILLLPLLFFGKDLGLTRKELTRKKKFTGYTVYFFIQILTGLFGAGTGPLIFATLILFMGLTIIESVATQIIPYLVLTFATLVLFGINGIINYQVGFVLLAGTTCGGYLGAHIAITAGDKWVRRVFAVIVFAMACKLLLF